MATPLPLTETLSKLGSGYPTKEGNYGLWFTRFFDGYEPGFGKVPDNGKTTFLKQMIDSGKCGNKDAITNALQRQITLTHTLGGQNAGFQCDWHMVTGMGNEHPLENGFTWHHTLGTPYIPGSTVKGLVRAWMEEFTDQTDSERQQWFGSMQKEDGKPEDSRAGELIFFDALPISEPQLAIDIMTPHMGKWYQDGGDIKQTASSGTLPSADTLPGDWHAPVPVPFLVSKNTQLMFSVAPRPGYKLDIEPVIEALESALAWLGVGSKTAIGYGHMERDDTSLKRIIEQAHELQLKAAEEAENALLSEPERKVKKVRELFEKEQEKNPSAKCREELRLLAQQDMSAWPDADKQALWEIAKKVFALHGGDKQTKKERENKIPSLKQRLSKALGLD